MQKARKRTIRRAAVTAAFGTLFGLAALLFSMSGSTQNSGTSRNTKTKGETNNTNTSKMIVSRPGSQPTAPGPEKNFTGKVTVEPVAPISGPSRLSSGRVTFEPGARSAWHTHPLGQTLVVTSGIGWTQAEGGPKEEIRTGDAVWCPPNTRHWHGATATTAMTHIAVQESLNGSPVNWMEKVSDEVYNAPDK